MVGAGTLDAGALLDELLESGAVGEAGEAVGDEFAAQVTLGHHFLRAVDQRQQEQPVVTRFGRERPDRSAQVARRGTFAKLA